MRYAFAFVLLGLFFVACAHRDPRDLKLRQQIVGTWSLGDSAEITFLPDGKFHSDLKRAANDATYHGTWDVRDGLLVTSTKHVSERYMPWETNMYSVLGSVDPNRNTIIHVDGTGLAILIEASPYHGAKTNVWERK